MKVRKAHARLGGSLKPFLLRHRRDVSHRAWWVGREADPRSIEPGTRGSTLRWLPGLDVSGDAELVHYLMMRAVQEQKDGRGSTSLGADLGGSYAFFRKGELRRMLPGRNEEARRYLKLVKRAVRGKNSHEHPKVAVTAERAFQACLVLAPDWPFRRREIVEGVLREAEIEALPDDEDIDAAGHEGRHEDVAAWKDVLEGRAGQATLAPYMADRSIKVPSLLTRWPWAALAPLPARLRALAARMLRRMILSPGFLARFILDDPGTRPEIDDDTADDDWTSLIHQRYRTPPAAGESTRERFDAYLETLQRAVDLEEQITVYEEASRNRDIVTRVTGKVASSERDRLFVGFNTPLVPEVLIVTTVGQEGIDLHRECRHVIHHDLPWNPATLEQRTGRVDRIGSKTERLRGNGNGDCSLDVAIPYIAGTYDEHRFRVVHGRAHSRRRRIR